MRLRHSPLSVTAGRAVHGKELDDDDVSGEHSRHATPRQVVAMITLVLAGLGVLVVLAVVVGVVDAAMASGWRRVAAERRENWESRQMQHHGIDHSADVDDD